MSQQNDVIERKYKHILDVARTMLIHMHALKYLLADAVLSTCHLINKIPSSVLHGKSLFHVYIQTKVSSQFPPHVLGCTCFVQDLSLGLDKLSSRFIKCIFVGYSRTPKGYRCYSLSTRKYFVLADVTFF